MKGILDPRHGDGPARNIDYLLDNILSESGRQLHWQSVDVDGRLVEEIDAATVRFSWQEGPMEG